MDEIYEEKKVFSSSETDSSSPGGDRPGDVVEEFAEEARRKGKGFLEEQKATAANSLGSIASALHDTCARLESEQPSTARLFGQGADMLEGIAANLHKSDAEGLLHQAQDLSRRQPALMLGGAVAAGFVLSRMLKSTSHRPEAQYRSRSDVFEGAKESVRSRFEGMREEERGDSGIILSPNEPMQKETEVKTADEPAKQTLITPEEERHATE